MKIREKTGNTKGRHVKPTGKDTNEMWSEAIRPNMGPKADLENNST